MNRYTHYLYPITTGVLIVSLVGIIVTFQKIHDSYNKPFTTKITAQTRNLLPAKFLPYITFGFDNFITDMYWLRAVQDFVAWDGRDPYYLNYFRNISTLDPTFKYPYLFSILIVPQNKDIVTLNEVARIAENGLKFIPTSWEIPFYLGTQYYLFTKEYTLAESYLERAAKIPGAPDGVFLLYSNFIGRNSPMPVRGAEDYILAQQLLKVIANNTDNETIKKMAEKGITEKLVTQMLEKGIIAYKERYKRYPRTTQEMINVNFVNLPQEFLENFDVTINQTNGSFMITEKTRS